MIGVWALREARRRAAAVLRAFVRRRNERRAIANLSGYPDAMLKDIGLSRGSIPFAVRGRGKKPDTER